MKLLLISDIHLGIKQNSDFFLDVTKNFFKEQVSNCIKDKDIDQLWILGDYYDNRYNTNVLVNNVGLNIIKHILSTHENLEVKIILGNHDIFYKNSLSITSLKEFEYMNHPRLEIIRKVKSYTFNDKTLLAVPWLIHGSENWTQYRKNITKFEETGEKQANYCFGHFEINGFEVVKGVIHKNGLSQKDFRAFDMTFSGHFHIRNKIGNIQYLGCPFELTWNDYGNKKGMTILDTETDKVEFIENNISPKHKHIKLSSVLKNNDILDNADNNLIKFHIDKTIQESDLSDVLSKLDNKKPFNTQIIDERYDIEIEDEDIEIEDLLETDALKYALDYAEQIDISDELELSQIKSRIIKLFNKAATETE